MTLGSSFSSLELRRPSRPDALTVGVRRSTRLLNGRPGRECESCTACASRTAFGIEISGRCLAPEEIVALPYRSCSAASLIATCRDPRPAGHGPVICAKQDTVPAQGPPSWPSAGGLPAGDRLLGRRRPPACSKGASAGLSSSPAAAPAPGQGRQPLRAHRARRPRQRLGLARIPPLGTDAPGRGKHEPPDADGQIQGAREPALLLQALSRCHRPDHQPARPRTSS